MEVELPAVWVVYEWYGEPGLKAVFATEALAWAHKAQLSADYNTETILILRCPVETTLPTRDPDGYIWNCWHYAGGGFEYVRPTDEKEECNG